MAQPSSCTAGHTVRYQGGFIVNKQIRGKNHDIFKEICQ